MTRRRFTIKPGVSLQGTGNFQAVLQEDEGGDRAGRGGRTSPTLIPRMDWPMGRVEPSTFRVPYGLTPSCMPPQPVGIVADPLATAMAFVQHLGGAGINNVHKYLPRWVGRAATPQRHAPFCNLCIVEWEWWGFKDHNNREGKGINLS